jgi:BolA protein
MNVEDTLRERLLSQFAPQHLELDNESHQHSVPANSETHFRLVMVSDAFAGKRAVARHQQVYGAIPDLLEGPLHALAMHLYSPDEWASRLLDAPESPRCRGGSRTDGSAA